MVKTEKRQVKILRGCTWAESKFSDIKKDFIFRLFEDDKTPVTINGNPNFLAVSDVYFNHDKVRTVNVEEYNGL